jgi:tol-pal system beta propeller repeat protein TolB
MNCAGQDWEEIGDFERDSIIDRHASWSPDSTRISYIKEFADHTEIWVMNDDGRNSRMLIGNTAFTSSHSWSPDNSGIAFVSPQNELSIFELASRSTLHVTNGDMTERDPDWSPDGSKLVFSARVQGNRDIFIVNKDGSDLTRLTNHEADDTTPDWSPDGNKIAFSSNRDGDHDIYILDLSQGGEGPGSPPRRFTRRYTQDVYPDWSPDGKHIVYLAHLEGNTHGEILIKDVSGRYRIILTSNNYYHSPVWRP